MLSYHTYIYKNTYIHTYSTYQCHKAEGLVVSGAGDIQTSDVHIGIVQNLQHL